MRIIIITGASGFLGKALTKKLLENGDKVYAVVRDKNKLKDLMGHPNLIVLTLNMSDFERMYEYIMEENVDCIYHFAWEGVSGEKNGKIDIQLNNLVYTVKFFNSIDMLKARKFIFIGSSYQYRVEEHIESGKIILKKNNTYGAAKAATEVLCKTIAVVKEYQFNTVLFTNVFGVGDESNRSTNTLIKDMLSSIEPKLIEGEHVHDWLYIDDAIDGLIAVEKKGINLKEYYIGDVPRKFKEIVENVRDIINPNLSLYFGEYPDNSFIDYSQIDMEAMYNDTGFRANSDFKESILKTAKWLLEKQCR